MGQYENIIFGNLGQFGLFQIFIFLACNIAETPASWAMTIMSFAGATPDWWSVKEVRNLTNNATYTVRSYKVCPTTLNETIEFSTEIKTIVTEWHLICEKDWIPSIITTIQMGGVLTGAFAIGQLGDLVGRKKCFYGVYCLLLLLTFASSFSTNWQTFASLRFFIGVTLGGFLVVSFTLPMEYVGVRWRTFVGSCPSWAIGIALLGPLAWLVPDWRKLSLITAGVGSPLLLTWWFVPESCRWLLVNGRIDEAEKVIYRMARINRKPVPDLTGLKSVMNSEREKATNSPKYSLVDLLRRWTYLKRVLVLGFMFFSVVQGYYGFTLGVVKLSGNRFWNMSLSGVVEAFAVLMVLVVSTKNLGYGTVSTCGRLGGLVAPQVIYIYKLNKASPYLVFGSMLVASGIMCLLNRDTYSSALEDQLEVEQPRSSNSNMPRTCSVTLNEEDGVKEAKSPKSTDDTRLVLSPSETKL